MASACKLGVRSFGVRGGRIAILAGLMLGVATPRAAVSQTAPTNTARPPVATVAKSAGAQDEQAVVRLAHFSFVQGRVLFRADSSGEWTDATVNMPLREGAQITTDADARAEIQFDDGSTLRLTDSAVVTFKSLYSDADGEFTELSLTDGTASIHVLSRYSVYQVDTPDGDVKAAGPAKVRMDAASYLEAGVSDGTATLTTLDGGDVQLQAGDLAEIKPDQQAPVIEDLPAPDDWDQFCDSRDAAMAPSDVYMPDDVALDAGRLSNYGTWQPDADYGNVWYPNQASDWEPYCDGSWVWAQPFGWTWVSLEVWGWAPYHYGSWIQRNGRWGWVPGPKNQHWSPAKVWFTRVGNAVVWTPLAPCEVHYTAPSVAFKHGDWSRYFSMGGAGVYVAAGPDYVQVKAWNNRALNRAAPSALSGPQSAEPIDHAFLPHNARFGGAIAATPAEFQAGTGYRPIRSNSLALLARGETDVSGGPNPTAGPADLRPIEAATTPTRRFATNAHYNATLDRAVYVAHGKPGAARVASASAPSAGGEKVYRERADWNSASSAQAAAVKARRAVDYLGPTISRPLPDTVVRHDYRPAAQEGNGEAGGGYAGAESYHARMRHWGENAQPRQAGVERRSRNPGAGNRGSGNVGAGGMGESMSRQPYAGPGRQMPSRPMEQAPARFDPPRQPMGPPPARQAPSPPPSRNNRH